jgi:aerobic-type carbon monoxide dehydrogenase small subunit (CoxS/CutS family)
MPLTLSINGTDHTVDVSSEQKLLYVLRDHLGLTGTKYGCGEGQCGACTVLLNGRAVRSCLTPASAAVGKKIITIEGLEQNGQLSAVQHAFLEVEAFQCAYCTSGMILSATDLLSRNPHPTNEQIISAMDGNVCRCGTYPRIIEAIRRAADASKEKA